MFAFRRYRHVALILLSLTSILAFAEPQFVRFDAEVCHRPQDVTAWGVSEEQLKVLCEASHFTVTLLRKKSQVIVLVGEHHITTSKGLAEAEAILPPFKFRGLEGVSSELFKSIKAISDDKIEAYQSPSLKMMAIRQGLAVFTYEKPRFNNSNGVILFNHDKPGITDADIAKDYQQFLLKIGGPQASADWGNLRYLKKRVYPFFRKAYPEAALNLNLEPDNERYDMRIRNRAAQMCQKNVPCTDAFIIDYRNAIMREIANEAVQLFPEEKVMLMVVGQAHIDGLVQSFVCEDGYEHHTLSRRGAFTHEQYLYAERLIRKKKINQVPDPITESYEFFPYNCQNN